MTELTIDYVIAEWKRDADVNELDISAEVRRTFNLHAKWVANIAHAKGHLQKLSKRYLSLRKLKFRYYRGEMSKEDLTKLGWIQWQGNKPLRNEMDEFLKGDKDLLNISDEIVNTETLIWTMEQILRSIHQRGYDLKTMLAAKQFYAGH